MNTNTNSSLPGLSFLLISAGLLFVYFNNLPVWLDRYNNTSLAPKFYLVLVAIAAAICVFYYGRSLNALRSTYVQWCIAVSIVFASAFVRVRLAGNHGEDLVSVKDQFELSIMILSIALLVYLIPRSYFKRLLPFIAFVAPAIILIEFFNPELFFGVYKNEADKARVSGFWGNENAAAEVVILAIVLAYRSVGKITLSLLYSFAFVAIIFTGSRAGMVAISVVGVSLLFQRRLPILYLAAPIALALSFSTMIGYVEQVLDSTGRVKGSERLIERITYFLDDDVELDDSGEARRTVALNGIEQSIQKPVFGHGVRYVDEDLGLGPHNLIVDLYYQFGVFGLLLWCWLVLLLLFRGGGVVSKLALFCFVWFSMFNHNILESPWWFLFLALSILPEESVGRRRKRKRRRSRNRGGSHDRVSNSLEHTV